MIEEKIHSNYFCALNALSSIIYAFGVVSKGFLFICFLVTLDVLSNVNSLFDTKNGNLLRIYSLFAKVGAMCVNFTTSDVITIDRE